MVLVDTSVWIRLFRKEGGDLAQRLASLVTENQAAICGPIWVEFIGGFRSIVKRQKYQEAFAVYPWLEMPRQAFELAAEWTAGRRGVGVIDAMIAATAH